MYMNKNGIIGFVILVLLGVAILTAVLAVSKPLINKTVILQIQNVVKK